MPTRRQRNGTPGEETRGGVHPAEQPARYEIRVRGTLDAHWSAWFAAMQVTSDAAGETTLAGPLPDQAALHGVLVKIRDLGLTLLAVRRLKPERGDTPPAG